ncbi:MAG TPA: MgtC/SapB family protein [Phycisphaerae bacterium]|nr:MgtC/SapB family protein [Phycisphaerae bacterium]
MPLVITWWDIAVRLGLALLAGAIVGLNRGEKGKPAGLRTTTLVCVAASLTMVLTNLLINTNGRPSDSFVQFDIMRLPLGLLSGMGFIGAGAIIRTRGDVQGVTTAATLWFVTVMGLCFGSGFIGTGLVSLGLAMFVLWAMGLLEHWLPQMRAGCLAITLSAEASEGLTRAQVRRMVEVHGNRIVSWKVRYREGRPRVIEARVRWHCLGKDAELPGFVENVAAAAGVERVVWDG